MHGSWSKSTAEFIQSEKEKFSPFSLVVFFVILVSGSVVLGFSQQLELFLGITQEILFSLCRSGLMLLLGL